MLRDLLLRAALGVMGGAIALSCSNDDKSSPEDLGVVQLALAGIGGDASGGAPVVGAGGADAGAGGQPEPPCDQVACVALGACMHCNPNNNQCEPYSAQDDHQCGSSDGSPCDADDFCAGGSTCPDEVEDAGVNCGPAPNPANLCDLRDTCDGVGKLCPAKFVPQNTVCRPNAAGSLCDEPEVCSGTSVDCPPDAFKTGGTACRVKVGDCDAADTCPGNSANCPDTKQLDGTVCNDSTNLCLLPLTTSCAAGACSAGTLKPCQRQPGQCEQPGTCVLGTGLCTFAPKPNTEPCDDGIACTTGDHCNGSGACVFGAEDDALCPFHACAAVTCDASAIGIPDRCVVVPGSAGITCNLYNPADTCDVRETCDGVLPDCPPDLVASAGTACVTASCTAFMQQDAAVCDGAARSCPSTPPVSCSGYACDGPVCRSDCADDQDCDPGHYCANNTCEERIGAGEPCQDDTQCSAGAENCVDGVCCDTECDDQCEACDIAGSEGTCSVVSGEQPHGERTPCAGDGSSCNGICAGALRSVCEFPDAQTVCQDAACDPATGVAVEQAFCDGVGSCATTDAIECTPFVCGATACRGDCVTDAQCASGAFCKAGKCTATQEPGESCTRDQQCASGFCTDGVCCEARCDGQCEECNGAGNCAAVSGAPTGQRPACAGDDGPCAGACDGGNRLACAYSGAAVVCRDAACADGEATVAAHCSGTGSCAPVETVICPNGCEGAICAGDACVVGSDCEPGERCVAGTCVPQGEPGVSCSAAGDCDSGFCVDGVCCDQACDGQCEACDGASPGSCAPVSGAPHGSRPPCTSDGSTCGGACDGDEPDGCSYPDGTVCAPGVCSPGQGGTEAVATVESQCNGSGRCPAPRQQACGGAGCDAGEQLCNGDCADGSACPSGQYCSAGVCVATQPTGDPCQSNDACASGFCVDGYCCSSACDDRCAACDVPGELGQCSPVTGNTHGGRPGCQGGGACGAQCDGRSVTDCSFPDEDVSCGEPYCHDGSQVAASSCDGAGQCQAGDATSCPAFTCDGDTCSDACETDADCTRTLQCQEGQCVEPFLINAVDEGTCGCRTPGSHPERHGAWLALAGLSLWSLRRRRRSAHFQPRA